MLIQKAFKYRIYPSEDQKIFFAKHFGCVRFIYNYFLNRRKSAWKNDKTSLSYYDTAKELTILKQDPDLEWLGEVITQSLQSSLKNLDIAYDRFFKHFSKKPVFKRKFNHQSFKIPQYFKLSGDLLTIPKLKSPIKLGLSRRQRKIDGRIISITISKNPVNEYYASFQVEIEQLDQAMPRFSEDQIIGLDVGLTHFLINSNGDKIANPRTLSKNLNTIKYLNRQLSKKQKGSNNKAKARMPLAIKHLKITNIRKDFLHQISNKIVNENQVIIAETLGIMEMLQKNSRSQNRETMDVSWSEFFRQLAYKAKWRGKIFYQIDRWFASSRLCHDCGHKNEDLKLSDRKWICEYCDISHDRDINAAINILQQGLKDMKNDGLLWEDRHITGLWNAILSPIKREKQKLVEALVKGLSYDSEIIGSMRQETLALMQR